MLGWGTTWLNLAGKTTLIKLVLSACPIYLRSGLLAPKNILTQMSAMIKKFLWKGGKNRNHTFYLLNWNVICLLKELGGLVIQDPLYMNLAVGAKIVWKLIFDSSELWKIAFLNKYFHKNRIMCMEKV